MTPIPSPAKPILSVDQVSLDLAGRRILDDINLSLCQGEFLGLIGPNGGGKTSLLRILMGIWKPTRGQILWGQGMEGIKPRRGYVPQQTLSDRNYPLTALEIVKQGLSGPWPLLGSAARRNTDLAHHWMGRVGLAPQSCTPFVRLSGGQQRRVLLARALMDSPSVILLDEPTAGVDAEGQFHFCQLLSELTTEGIGVILVSHDIPLVTRHAHRIACLAVQLHWHGAASALESSTILHAYQCELERYQLHAHCQDGHTHSHSHPRP